MAVMATECRSNEFAVYDPFTGTIFFCSVNGGSRRDRDAVVHVLNHKEDRTMEGEGQFDERISGGRDTGRVPGYARAAMGGQQMAEQGETRAVSGGPCESNTYFGNGAAGRLRQRAHDLRVEAAGLEALAAVLPANLCAVSPVADRVLLEILGGAHRVYIGSRG